jgi:hypothetical protein
MGHCVAPGSHNRQNPRYRSQRIPCGTRQPAGASVYSGTPVVRNAGLDASQVRSNAVPHRSGFRFDGGGLIRSVGRSVGRRAQRGAPQSSTAVASAGVKQSRSGSTQGRSPWPIRVRMISALHGKKKNTADVQRTSGQTNGNYGNLSVPVNVASVLFRCRI